MYGNVAQLVEQGPFKAKVPGSSPGIPTIDNTNLSLLEEDFLLFLIFSIQSAVKQAYSKTVMENVTPDTL